MAVRMRLVYMDGDDRLNIFSESLTHISLGYLECELGRDVLRVREAHYVMDSLDCAFPLQRRRAVKAVGSVMLVNSFHLQISITGVRGAID